MDVDRIVKLADGNPGASVALSALADLQGSAEAFDKLEMLGIKGSDIYVIHSDLCGRDAAKMLKLVMKTEGVKLVDAASRQDYSGREVLAEELEEL